MVDINTIWVDFVESFLKNNAEELYDVIKASNNNDYYSYDLIFAWEWYKAHAKEGS